MAKESWGTLIMMATKKAMATSPSSVTSALALEAGASEASYCSCIKSYGYNCRASSRLKVCCSTYPQCAPGFFNPNKKVHELFHFYNVVKLKAVQNQPRKLSDIRLPKE